MIGEQEVFLDFTTHMILRGGLSVYALRATDLQRVAETAAKHGLDFDDAYQYIAAEAHGLTLISFDTDFDRTERGRMTPEEVLESQG